MDDLMLDFSKKGKSDLITKLATPAMYSETTTVTANVKDELDIAEILSTIPKITEPQRPVPATDTVEDNKTTKNKRVLPKPEYIIDNLALVTGEELLEIIGKKVLIRGSITKKGIMEVIEAGGIVDNFNIKGDAQKNTLISISFNTQKDGLYFTEAHLNSGSYSILVYKN
jgi:hypothetical protein